MKPYLEERGVLEEGKNSDITRLAAIEQEIKEKYSDSAQRPALLIEF